MSRYLALLALVAAPALLIACEGPKSTLAKAKPGECYTVVGRDSLGKPSLAKTPCAASAGALAATCPPPSAAPAGCVPGKATSSIGQTSRHVSKHFAARRGQSRTTSHSAYSSRQSRSYAVKSEASNTTTRFGDYQRVYTPDTPLYGGEVHAYREERQGHAYAPPPPPAPQGGYAYREERYEGRKPHQKGGVVIDRFERQSGGSAYSYSESSSSSSSSTSGYSSSGSSHGWRDCCGHGAGGSGRTPSPFDAQGYLTWRGKTPG